MLNGKTMYIYKVAISISYLEQGYYKCSFPDCSSSYTRKYRLKQHGRSKHVMRKEVEKTFAIHLELFVKYL